VTAGCVVSTAAGLTPVRAALRAAIDGGALVGFDIETVGPYITLPDGKRKPDARRHRVVGYAVTTPAGSWYVNARGPGTAPGADRDACLRLLRFTSQPAARVAGHNLAFELTVLERSEGIPVACRLCDSMLAAWHRGMRLPGKGGLKLKPLMAHYFNRRRPDFDAVMGGRAVDEVPADAVGPYCVADALDAVALWERCWGEMDAEERDDYTAVEEPCIRVTAHMVDVGIPLDADLLRSVAVDAGARMRDIAATFEALTTTGVKVLAKRDPGTGELFREPARCDCAGRQCAVAGCVGGILHYKNGRPRMRGAEREVVVRRGAHVGSDHQVARWCFDELRVWPRAGHPRTKKARTLSCKSDHVKPLLGLPGLGGQLAKLRLEYQALSKYAALYTTGMVDIAAQYDDGRLHTSYVMTGTATGRYSSSQPNVSNVPNAHKAAEHGVPAVRAAFVAPPGWRVVIRDIGQAELRVLCHHSRDPVLERVYRDCGDVHAELMTELGIVDRVLAKTTNFSCVYRIGARSLAVKLTVATGRRYTVGEAQACIDAFHARFARVRWYHDAAIESARTRGYARSIGGFRMPLPESEWAARRHYAENRAINYPIQGSVGTLLKRMLVALHDKWRGEGVLAGFGGTSDGRVQIQGQTYDEVIVLARADFAEQADADMRAVMESPTISAPLRVPLVSSGGIGNNWQAAK
jgi:DNA polymerase I-like protein with 3'-5' exonuclease and polymerase domains